MFIEDMKKLKKGDKVVKVRKLFQNYDRTLIPVEPKIYTISSDNIDIYLEESLNPYFKDERGHIVVRSQGCGRKPFCRDFETMENYLKGNYKSNIILDNERWTNGLSEFLEFKRVKDFNESKDDREQSLKELEGL